jgi:excisionase family DNA binding protein
MVTGGESRKTSVRRAHTPPFSPSAKPTNGSGLSLAVPDELVEALAGRVADLLAERLPHRPEPWLDVDGAADYLACKPHRVYDLKAEGRLRFAKDGTRLLFRREWLDACLEEDDA